VKASPYQVGLSCEFAPSGMPQFADMVRTRHVEHPTNSAKLLDFDGGRTKARPWTR